MFLKDFNHKLFGPRYQDETVVLHWLAYILSSWKKEHSISVSSCVCSGSPEREYSVLKLSVVLGKVKRTSE